MYNHHDMYSGGHARSSQHYRFDDFRRRGRPAYEDPDVYDTSRYIEYEQKEPSPHRSRDVERSPARRRSHSPPVSPPVPRPLGPSPEYLSTSAEPPRAVDPAAQRKLLILDLNGTLLWRKDKRVPYPRPYMPTFRAYLFSEETRKWLDIMVWSSAQPHNVNMMVRRCFFDPRSGYVPSEAKDGSDEWDDLLIAVWARDTLGLSRHDYSRKSQTTKDLTKPWSALQGSQEHSALTTFLLDDSPSKVRLQPYNHICVPEYNGDRRDQDLRVKSKLLYATFKKLPSYNQECASTLDSEASTSTSTPKAHSTPISSSDTTQDIVEKGTASDSSIKSSEAGKGSEFDINDRSRSERRKEKKERKKKERALRKLEETILGSSKVEEASGTSRLHAFSVGGDTTSANNDAQGEEFDETLLAVIGILDELKMQGNVSAWVRSGGLWAGNEPPYEVDPSTLLHDNFQRASSPTDAEVEDFELQLTELSKTSPRRASPPTSPTAVQSPPTSPVLSFSDRKRNRSGTSDALSKEGESDAKKSKSDPLGENEIPAGNDAETIGTKSPKDSRGPRVSVDTLCHLDIDKHSSVSPNMWFEDEPTFKYWVERGRGALKALGIEEEDGIEVL